MTIYIVTNSENGGYVVGAFDNFDKARQCQWSEVSADAESTPLKVYEVQLQLTTAKNE